MLLPNIFPFSIPDPIHHLPASAAFTVRGCASQNCRDLIETHSGRLLTNDHYRSQGTELDSSDTQYHTHTAAVSNLGGDTQLLT
jgi:hypothetical protein